MDKLADPNSAQSYLYPSIRPYEARLLDVGDGHSIYVEQCGNPDGTPVVVLHGGPGGGCSPFMRRFFDPQNYRIILFDQRGCGRSKPLGHVEANTTWHLVADIERIREELQIEKWMVFGGSWGATLALAYGQCHPDRVRHIILRGVFAARQRELDWFYKGGAAKFWPELWDNFVTPIPEEERHDLLSAYQKRLFSGNLEQEKEFGGYWASFENAMASIYSDGTSASSGEFARVFARLENHYFINNAFLERENQLVEDMHKLKDVPGTIVQGRFDVICPPQTAYEVHKNWPNSELIMAPLSGHALSEPQITRLLVQVMNRLAVD